MGARAEPAAAAVGGHREPVFLDQGRTAVGTVHVGHRPDLVDLVATGHPLGGEDHRVRRGRRVVDLPWLAVHADVDQVRSVAVEPVAHGDDLVAVSVHHLLAGRGVVAEPRRDGGLHAGLGPSPGLPGQGGDQSMPAHPLRRGQGGGQDLEAVAVEEPGVGLAGQEGGVTERAGEEVPVGGDPVDAGPGQRGGQGGGRLGAGGGVHDDLGQHGVVVGTDHAARFHPAVHPDHAVELHGGVDGHRGVQLVQDRAAHLEAVEGSRGGKPPLGRVLGVEAGLDGVPLRTVLHRVVHLGGQGGAPGDQQLEADQVEAGHGLGHRVLHLQSGVHLEEVRVAPPVEDELHRAGVDIAHGLGGGHGRVRQTGPQRRGHRRETALPR